MLYGSCASIQFISVVSRWPAAAVPKFGPSILNSLEFLSNVLSGAKLPVERLRLISFDII